jgi:hypothetical protein
MMSRSIVLLAALAGFAALPTPGAVAAEDMISVVKGGSNVGRGGCKAALEYEHQYDKDGITSGRNQPMLGTSMDPPRLETAGVQIVSSGVYRYESLLVLTFRRTGLVNASPATERREHRILTCSDATGAMNEDKVISRVRR